MWGFVVDFVDFYEVVDWCEVGEVDGFEVLDLVVECVGEFVVDVEWVVVYVGDGVYFLDMWIGEFVDDKGFFGVEGVVEDVGYLDGEGFDFVVLENGLDFVGLVGLDFGKGKWCGVGGLGLKWDGEEG